ncbi:MAG: hypothetical protein EAZ97_09115 [Bacteroidetes bacterium]|nr:MAG: hypothetical protein EAZ97_09115 [Bacteroidota bacterium]
MAKKIKSYSEAQLIDMFALVRLVGKNKLPLLDEWLEAQTTLSAAENELFEQIYQEAVQDIDGWQEEDLKMKFICFVLRLGNLRDSPKFKTYFEKTIETTIDGIFLKTKTDFMVAKGILDMPQVPFFHFQEWKKQRDPNGDPMAQLLEAFLIAQNKNKSEKAVYGCTITGKYWEFVIMEGKKYCISKSFDCTQKEDLLKIIAVLRKFKEILETKLL